MCCVVAVHGLHVYGSSSAVHIILSKCVPSSSVVVTLSVQHWQSILCCFMW